MVFETLGSYMGWEKQAAGRGVEAELVQAGRRCPGRAALPLGAFVARLEEVLSAPLIAAAPRV